MIFHKSIMSASLYVVFAVAIFQISSLEAGHINVKFEDVNIDYVNDEYIDEDTFELAVNYINETYNTLRCKVKVVKKFPDDVRISLKVYAYAFNDFRIPMGISVNISICDVKTAPILVMPFISAIGGDPDKCGPDEGEYGNEDFYPVDPEMLPSVFPRNQYRLNVVIDSPSMTMLKVEFYVQII